MAATFSVPARRPRSWPPPLMCGSAMWISPRLIKAPAPAGRQACARKWSASRRPSAARSQSMRPGACTRRRAQPVGGMHDVGNLADRLDDAGLVVGKHHRTQGTLGPSNRASKSKKIDDSVRGSPALVQWNQRGNARREHRRMLDRRHEQPVTLALSPASRAPASAQHVGFGRAAVEGDVFGFRANELSHL